MINSNINTLEEVNNMSEKNIWDLFNAIEVNEDMSEISEEYEDDTDSLSSDTESCLNCKSKNSLIQDRKEGFVVCNECGSISDELLDHNPDWKNYNDNNGSTSRCGIATNFFLPKSSLGTTIAGSNFNRLKRLHNWGSMPYRERSLYIVLDNISTRCEKHSIKKNIVDDAKLMYKKISECKHKEGKNNGKFIIIRGSNRRSLIAACVFFACKLNGHTRSPKEIAKVFDLKMTEITKGCKKFLQLMRTYSTSYKLDSSTPEHFIIRYCNALKIHKKDTESAQTISRNVQKLGLASDHTPPSVAAGSILLMSKMNNLSLTKKSISKKFSISEVTISKIYKKIEEYKKLLINTEETDKIIKMMNQM